MSAREALERELAMIAGLLRQPSHRGRGAAYSTSGCEIVLFHEKDRMNVRRTRECMAPLKGEAAFDSRRKARELLADRAAVRGAHASDFAHAAERGRDAMRTNR